MNHCFKTAFLIALQGALVVSASALTINDGTTIDNLSRINSTVQPLPGTEVSLNIRLGSGHVTASQTGSSAANVHTAWYVQNATITNPEYVVSAEFRPSAINTANRGGVIGWLNQATGKAIAFKVVPVGSGATPASFRMSVLDFSEGASPEVADGLYSLDGSSVSLQQASVPLGVDYRSQDFATFELAFIPPTEEELELLTNAVARVTARVLQASSDGTATNQVSQSIELLTTLPLPESTAHRAAYYSVLAVFFNTGTTDIGDYRNLAVDGEVEINEAPVIALIRPTEGQEFEEGVSITLEAQASDPDGSVAEVAFFEGDNLLATLDSEPYEWTWTGAAQRSYQISARATDDRGVSSSTFPVAIRVIAPNQPPQVFITAPADNSVFVEPATIALRATATDADGTVESVEYWANDNLLGAALPDGLGGFAFNWENVVAGEYTVTARATDDRGAVEDSTPIRVSVTPSTSEPPTMTVGVEGSELVIAWDIPGFQLQYKTDLGQPDWTDVPGTINQTQARLPLALNAQYFRLVGSGTPTGPSLSITVEGQEIVITWPASASGYALEETDALGSGTWTSVASSGNEYRTSNDGAQRFYRLTR